LHRQGHRRGGGSLEKFLYSAYKRKEKKCIHFFKKKTTSPAVFDPGFSAGRWAKAEVGTWGKVPRSS